MEKPRTDPVLVGLSGWDYAGWRGDFYPHTLPATRRLEYVADRFPTVEVNGSFYSLQRPSTYERWYDATPDGFVFALKGGRFVTHLKRLRDVEQGLANFFASGPLALAEKLGPILWQLPASLEFDEGLVASFLSLLPRSTRAAAQLARQHDDKVTGRTITSVDRDRRLLHALEVRHRSFDQDRFYGLLADFDVACVVSDSPTWPMLDRRTAQHAYARLHGHSELYASGYSSGSLDRWAQRCERWAQEGPVYVYFDNDARGRAPYDALGLTQRLDDRSPQEHGWST